MEKRSPPKSDLPGLSKAFEVSSDRWWKTWKADDFLIPNIHGKWELDSAYDALRPLPEPETLTPLITAVAAALAAPLDPNQGRLLIALMIERFPNASPHAPEVYFEGLVDGAASESLCSHAVAAAGDEIFKTMKFAPTGSEFLDLCKAKQARLVTALSSMRKAVELRTRIEIAIDAAVEKRDADLPEDEVRPWPYEPVLAAQAAEEERLRQERVEVCRHEMEAARARRERGEVQF